MRNNDGYFEYIWFDYRNFTEKWLKRAEDNDRDFDKADSFIALWIAFNGWMRGKFGENKKDWELVRDIKRFEEMKNIYNRLKESNENLKNMLQELSTHSVVNMQFINDRTKDRKYTNTYESLIDTIYQIRCNLFHGRKGTQETEEDYTLICLVHDILLPIFKECISTCGY